MTEEVIFETESIQTRTGVASHLRQVADSLEEGGSLTLRSGDRSVTLDPPDSVEFEVKAERENGERSVEFELEWDDEAGDKSGTDLNIE